MVLIFMGVWWMTHIVTYIQVSVYRNKIITLGLRWNGWHLEDNIFKLIFLFANCGIVLLQFHIFFSIGIVVLQFNNFFPIVQCC